MDATYLTKSDDRSVDALEVKSLCDKIKLAYQLTGTYVAAICVYPEQLQIAMEELKGTGIQFATVVNFPTGDESIEEVKQQMMDAILKGADEIDIVMPYQLLQIGNQDEVKRFLLECREKTQGKKLKVIIESGVLSLCHINNATRIAGEIGADFVKTSTGKVKGATVEAVQEMLFVLQEFWRQNIHCGLKVSGGVTMNNVTDYLKLMRASSLHLLYKSSEAENANTDQIHSDVFRIGASKLLDDIILR